MSQGLTAGAVARRLGVAVTTLRTWHQRYGLGPSEHEPGQHRRYTAGDVARLELMQRLIVGGVAPGEAARWVRRLPDGQPDAPLTAEPPEPGAVPTGPAESGRTNRDGGGLALGPAHPAARGISRAAVRLDASGVRRGVTDAIAKLGVVAAWDQVVRPVLQAIGDRHAGRGDFVEVEHLVSGCVWAAFATVPRPPAEVPVRILLACADEEQHTLPLEALAAALAEYGVPCRMLGARVPRRALIAAVRRTGPLAVVIWSQHPSTANPEILTAVAAVPRRPVVVAVAGPGWSGIALPPGVATPATLGEAIKLLTHVNAA